MTRPAERGGPRYPPGVLRAWACELLEVVGTPAGVAEVVARHLVDADLAGHTGHGLRMLPTYLDDIAEGRLHVAVEPSVVSERRAHLVVDGGFGFGHHTIAWTLDRVLDRAGSQGLCAASVVRCGHTGRLGGYVLDGASRGAVVLLTVGTLADDGDAVVVAHGSRRPLLGTNPIAFGYPADPPVVLDMATSAMAYYDVVRLAERDGEVPPRVVVDARGEPTRQAADLLRDGSLVPFGGYKGYGLGVLAGLLGGLGVQGAAPGLAGAFLLAIDRSGASEEAASAALERVRRAEPVHSGAPVTLPGDRSRHNAVESEASGVGLPADLLAGIDRRLAATGLSPPPVPEPL